MNICKVKGCRFENSHVTSHHICGSCGKYGHGMVECGNRRLMNNLQNKFGKDELSDQHKCEVITCKDKHYHTTLGHLCRVCEKGFHKETECKFVIVENSEQYDPFLREISKSFKYILPNKNNWKLNLDCLSLIEEILTNEYKQQLSKTICKIYTIRDLFLSGKHNYSPIGDMFFEIVRNKIKTSDENLYFEFSAGMGCVVAVRVDKIHLPLTSFFLHSDCQGQYGESTNHIPMYNNFVKGCKIMDENLININYLN